MSASPNCQVKDGAGAYQTPPPRVQITPGNTVTIALISSAGVDTWTIQCTSTDETNSAATINAGLTVNNSTKTATFTAPAAGSALIFTSTVTQGGTAYSTTFKVFTAATTSFEVIAAGERYESNATYGYTGALNAPIRSGLPAPPTGTAGGNLSGTYPNPVVAEINNATAPATPVAGDVGKAITVTAAGAYGNAFVSNVNGTAIGAGGALTIGQSLRATGTAAASFGAVDLSNSSAVANTLPFANLPSGLANFHTARAVATANNAITGAATIDGVVLNTSDRVLLQNQTTPSQNGIWVVNTGGAWTRPTDWSTAGVPLAENWIVVSEGTANAHTVWRVSTQGTITVDTTSVTIAQYTTTVADATTSTKGIVQLTNDFAGTATAPVVQQITGVSNNATIAATQTTWGANSNGVLSIRATGSTTSTTAVTLITYAAVTNTTIRVDAIANAFHSSGTTTGYGSFSVTNGFTFLAGFSTMGSQVTNDSRNGGTGTLTAPTITTSGSNVIVQVTGITSTTTHWFAFAQITLAQ